MKIQNRKKRYALRASAVFALVFVFLLECCIGINSTVAVQKDGSGTINLEYQVMNGLESLGKLDGNEQWPLIPVGRSDIERTVNRIEGLRLETFTSRREADNTVYRIKLSFSRLEALLAFLDASRSAENTGQKAAVRKENDKTVLLLTLSSGRTENLNPELLELLSSLTEGYFFTIGFSFPSEPSVSFIDGTGKPFTNLPAGTCTVQQRRLSFSSSMYDLLAVNDTVIMKITY